MSGDEKSPDKPYMAKNPKPSIAYMARNEKGKTALLHLDKDIKDRT